MFIEAESEQEAAKNREMFLEEGETEEMMKAIDDFIKINPLLARGTFTPTKALHVGSQVDGISIGYFRRNEGAHPVLFMFLVSERSDWEMSVDRVSNCPEASWRRMFISQPPRPEFRAELKVDLEYWAYRDLRSEVRKIDPEWHPGRSLGAVFAVLEKEYKEVLPVLEDIRDLQKKM